MSTGKNSPIAWTGTRPGRHQTCWTFFGMASGSQQRCALVRSYQLSRRLLSMSSAGKTLRVKKTTAKSRSPARWPCDKVLLTWGQHWLPGYTPWRRGAGALEGSRVSAAACSTRPVRCRRRRCRGAVREIPHGFKSIIASHSDTTLVFNSIFCAGHKSRETERHSLRQLIPSALV